MALGHPLEPPEVHTKNRVGIFLKYCHPSLQFTVSLKQAPKAWHFATLAPPSKIIVYRHFTHYKVRLWTLKVDHDSEIGDNVAPPDFAMAIVTFRYIRSNRNTKRTRAALPLISSQIRKS